MRQAKRMPHQPYCAMSNSGSLEHDEAANEGGASNYFERGDNSSFASSSAGQHDLPLNCHPAAARASANVTPFGAMSVPA